MFCETLSYGLCSCVRFTNKLVVRECNLLHNYRVGKKIIASSRRLISEEKKEIAEMLSLRPNHKHHNSQSQAMIRKNYGKLVTLKVYIQNLKGSVRELTHKGLKDACTAHSG